MTCYHPMTAYRLENGDVVFNERGAVKETLSLPCGRCFGCKMARANHWANRCMHEATQWKYNLFVTLTYRLDALPEFWSLNYRHFQLFMKRLRKDHPGVRFFMSGEYGEHRSHPHYHAILFNLKLDDLEPLSVNSAGDQLYSSQYLDRVWGLGMCAIGSLTAKSARYVAKYSLKKSYGRHSEQDYEIVDTITGSVGHRVPEFCHMSTKPGIGAMWFDKFHRDVYPTGVLIVDGHQCSPPRYYDKLAKRRGYDVDQIKAERVVKALEHSEDYTPERLAIREEAAVLAYKQRNLQRSI